MFLMFVLTLADGLCCAWLVYPILFGCRCPETGTSSIDWAQMSRFFLKTETESSLRNAVFYTKSGWFFLNKTRRWLMSRNSCSHLHTLVPWPRIFSPTLKMEGYVPPKRRFTQYIQGATSQKTAFFIVTAMKTSNLTNYISLHP
jgi:hypothetical protein